jgi:ADP-ribose pyrophosphatase YjhB (NUDIX family)
MIKDQTEHHPIPAVRGFIEDSYGRVLILRRSNTRYGEGAWCLPGGKVDYGQTVESAAAVELREELSLELVRAEFLFYQNSLPPDLDGLHYINFYFHCVTRGEISLNDESSEFAWIGPEDVDQYALVFKNDEAIRRYFSERPTPPRPYTEKEEDHVRKKPS